MKGSISAEAPIPAVLMMPMARPDTSGRLLSRVIAKLMIDTPLNNPPTKSSTRSAVSGRSGMPRMADHTASRMTGPLSITLFRRFRLSETQPAIGPPMPQPISISDMVAPAAGRDRP